VVMIGQKIRAIRREQHLSLREVAEKADVSISHLSQVESGKTNPSVATLTRIATALSVPFDRFFVSEPDIVEGDAQSALPDGSGPGSQHERAVEHLDATHAGGKRPSRFHIERVVMRPEERPTIQLQGGVTWARLTSEQESGIEFREAIYEVGANSGPTMQYHMGREFGLVLDGNVLLEIGFERFELSVGDSFAFDSTHPHRFSNTGTIPLRIMWVTFDPLQLDK